MKFDGNLPAALTLGVLFREAVTGALAQTGAVLPDAIVPVPLHRGRLRTRGFNQALELARPLARALRRPLLARACLRVRATQPQSSLNSAAARRRNMANAFRLARPLTGLQRVAIVDDVLTTGATAQSLARLLRTAGIAQVAVWACAGPSADGG
jgi:ComF family protein